MKQLSSKDRNFISREMKISLESIESKLNEDFLSPYRSRFEDAIAFFTNSIRKQSEQGYKFDCSPFKDSPAKNEINDHYSKLCKEINDPSAEVVLDSIRHAFCSYAYNGIHELFTHQAKESWYPKVILDCVITPNHIDLLPKKVTLYRGTDISEFKKSMFGQSWTTKESVAHKFAYVHYKNQHWFKKVDRIILKTEYPRQFVYYASQEPEFEVAIDTSKISNVERIK